MEARHTDKRLVAHPPPASDPAGGATRLLMRYSVYVLKSSKTNRRYIGSTCHVEKRLLIHNAGHSRYTKAHRPWQLIYEEHYDTRAEAVRRERFFKSTPGRRWLDQHGEIMPLGSVIDAGLPVRTEK